MIKLVMAQEVGQPQRLLFLRPARAVPLVEQLAQLRLFLLGDGPVDELSLQFPEAGILRSLRFRSPQRLYSMPLSSISNRHLPSAPVYHPVSRKMVSMATPWRSISLARSRASRSARLAFSPPKL